MTLAKALEDISKMSYSDMLARLFALLASDLFTWHDVTEDQFDTEAVQVLAAGLKTRRQTVFVLARYEDNEEEPLVLAVYPLQDKAKKVTAENYQLEWLWEQVTNSDGKATPVPR